MSDFFTNCKGELRCFFYRIFNNLKMFSTFQNTQARICHILKGF